ncbi:MAG: hypothetical protein AAF957_07525 [Planctomycetota bacterium]
MGGLRYVLWILPAILVAIGTVGFTARRGALESWLRARPLLDAVQAELEARVTERDALWGETQEGLAFYHYAAAVQQAEILDSRGGAEWRRELAEALSGEEGAIEAAAALVDDEGVRRCLGALHDGAHSCDAALEIDWSQIGAPLPSFQAALTVERLAFVDACARLSAGDDVGAVRGLLDALQLGADLAEAPLATCDLLGSSILGAGRVEQLLTVRGFDHLAPEARTMLLEGLVRLDERVTIEGASTKGEFVLLARTIEAELDAAEKRPFAQCDASRSELSDFIRLRARQLQQVDWAIDESPSAGLVAVEANAEANGSSPSHLLREVSASTDAALALRLEHLCRMRAALAGLVALDKGWQRQVRDPFGNAFDVRVSDWGVTVRGVDDESIDEQIVLMR